ncbi:MAG TPA: hypothetical protein VGU02_07375 [Gaiellaceae bacterium]|nr:hypothetical protein [Gaiellaceae bacterium]
MFVGGVVVPLALASSTPPIKGAHYRGEDATRGAVTLTVSGTGANFTSGRFNVTLLGQAGRGSCVGPAHVTLTSTQAVQITPRGTFNLSGTFPFREPSPDPQAFRGTAHAIVRGAFSNGGKRVSGTVEMTASAPHLTCRSGVIRFTATLA